MNRHISLLGALLGFQILLIAALMIFDSGDSSAGSSSFLDLAGRTVDGMILMGPDGEKVVLRKSEDNWLLDAGQDFPANPEKISGLLNKLRATTALWPVGTSDELAARFEVSAEQFQRHVQLQEKNEIVADLFLGTSPGFRKVHARLANESETYSIAFSNFEVSLKPVDWLDKSLLKPTAELSRISREGSWTLEKSAEGWVLQDILEDESQDQEKIQALVSKLENLRVSGWVGDGAGEPEEEPAEQGVNSGEILFSLTVTQADDFNIRYDFYQQPDEEDYLLRSSAREGLFTLAAYNAEPLDRKRADLLQDSSEAVSSSSGTAKASGQ